MDTIEKRNITKEDIFLKARLLSEGVRKEVKNPPEKWGNIYRPIVLDGCDLVSLLRPNPYSRLEAVIDGDHVTLSDMGEVLGTATFDERPDWFDVLLSNGEPAMTALPGMTPDLIPIVQNHVCYNQASGQGCKYCSSFRAVESISKPYWAGTSTDTLQHRSELAAEAIKIAIDHGWRGQISFSGGVLPPPQRGDLTDRLEAFMEPLHDMVGTDTLSEMHITANCYPPDDFSDMYKWRDFGINATDIDLETMDGAYFAAICPAKHAAHPLEYWKEAQLAAVDVFGSWRGSCTSVVVGIEPMTALVEGVEELLTNGVLTTPLHFQPTPGSAYEQFRPPTADWIVEAIEKMADSHFRHEDKMDVPLLEDDRPGYTRTGRSYFVLLLTDEIWRRGQEMGKLPPGLPKQGA